MSLLVNHHRVRAAPHSVRVEPASLTTWENPYNHSTTTVATLRPPPRHSTTRYHHRRRKE